MDRVLAGFSSRSVDLAALADRTPAPKLTNSGWLKCRPSVPTLALCGRVVLLNVCVFTGDNGTNTVPSLIELDRRYRDRGLTLIGIHTPELPPYSGEPTRATWRAPGRSAASPIPMPRTARTWDGCGIRCWPSFVLIDMRAWVRYTGYGTFHRDDAAFRAWGERIREVLAA